MKRYKRGLMIGKFMPLHKGHELMIEFGLKNCHKFFVLVSGSESDELFPHQRASWIRKTYPDIRVIAETNTIPEPAYDENNIGIGEVFWQAWVAKIHDLFGSIDAVFTNDLYGKVLAEKLNATWCPIDIDRKAIPISATAIRKDPNTNFKYLNKYAKEFYSSTIAIVGPESTGKTNLAENLASAFDGGYVPEYGRTLTEIKPKLDAQDFADIISTQALLVDKVSKEHRLTFVDTEGYTTFLFTESYLGKLSKNIGRLAQVEAFKYDAYILLAPSVPWVRDGTRNMYKAGERIDFFIRFKSYLDSMEVPYIVIDNPDFNERTRQAIEYCQEL